MTDLLLALIGSSGASRGAAEEAGKRDEGCAGAEFGRRGAGRGGDACESFGESGESLVVALEGGAFVVGEVDGFEHPVDAVLDGQHLAGAALFREVERTAGAGQPVGAFGEEVVGAVALAEVVVLPGLTVRGGAGQDGVAVDQDFDGAQVAGEVVGFPVGGGEGALQDRGVVPGAGRVLVPEPAA